MTQLSFLSIGLWAHHLVDKPMHDRNIRVKIALVNKKHLALYSSNSRDSAIILRVLEPATLGLREASHQTEFQKRLILACNLLLEDSVLVLNETKPSKPKATNFSEELSEIAKLSSKEIFKTNLVKSRPKRSSTITIDYYDVLDEKEVFPVIVMLNKLQGMSFSDKIQLFDLQKSLDIFSFAVAMPEKVSCFSQLYSSLELALNCDGIKRKGNEIDSGVAQFTGVKETIVKEWREFNNRLKHVDRTPFDRAKYLEGLKNIDSYLPDIRKTVSSLILYRLKKNLALDRNIRNTSLLRLSTRRLLKKFGPMLNRTEIEAYEKKYGMPSFDIVFYHPLDTKTLWGNAKQYFLNTVLHSHIANNIYDLLYEGYEAWIRDVSSSGKMKITPEHTRYAMSLEAQNMSEDGMPLIFRFIDGWLVISQDHYSGAYNSTAQKFYDYFEILVDTSDIPYDDDDLEFERRVAAKEREAMKRWKKLRMQLTGSTQ